MGGWEVIARRPCDEASPSAISNGDELNSTTIEQVISVRFVFGDCRVVRRAALLAMT